jgi:O-antigen ligase
MFFLEKNNRHNYVYAILLILLIYLLTLSILTLVGLMTEELIILALLSPIVMSFLVVIIFYNFHIGFTTLMLILPFENLLGIGGAGGIVRYIVLITALGSLLQGFLTHNIADLFKQPIFKLILALNIWSFATILWSVNSERTLVLSGTIFINLLLFSILFLSNRKWLSIYWSSLLISCTCSVIFGSFLPRPEGLENNLDRFTTGGQDPNDIAGLLLITFSVGVFVFYPKLKSKVSKFLMVFSLITLLVGVLLTLSRTGLTSMIVPLSFLVLRKIDKKIPWYLLFVLFIGIIYICAMDSFNDLLNVFVFPLFSRFNSLDESTLSRGRFDVWLSAIEVIKNNFLLGVGTGGMPYIIDDYSGEVLSRSAYNSEIGLVAHNIILSVWAEMGLIGITIFVLILFIGFKYTLALAKKDSWITGMLVSMILVLAMGISLSWEHKKIVYILLGSISLLYKSKNAV